MFLLKLLWEGAIRGSSQSPPQGGLDVANPKGLPSPVQSGPSFTPVLAQGGWQWRIFSFFFIFRMLPAQTVPLFPINISTLGFPGGSDGKEPACQCRRPGSGRSPEEKNDNLLQYSCLENSMECSPPGSPTGGLHSMGSQRVGHN